MSVEIGDYVLATKYSDRDPLDPWRVGYVVKIVQSKRGLGYIVGNRDGTWEDNREYLYVKHITGEFGREWIEFHRD